MIEYIHSTTEHLSTLHIEWSYKKKKKKMTLGDMVEIKNFLGESFPFEPRMF